MKHHKQHIGYTYLLKFIPTGQLYYGSRTAIGCHPSELWINYFSSSNYIKKLIKEYGVNSFEYEVRKTFEISPRDALDWELKVLRRIGARNRNDFLNRSDGIKFGSHAGHKNPNFGKHWSEDFKESRRAALIGKTYEERYGKEKAELMLKNLSMAKSGNNNPMFGKSRPEIVGDLNPSKQPDVIDKIKLKKSSSDLIKHHCEWCDLDFTIQNYIKAHGDKCRKATTPNICPSCGSEYWTKKKTCSRKCGYHLRKKFYGK